MLAQEPDLEHATLRVLSRIGEGEIRLGGGMPQARPGPREVTEADATGSANRIQSLW